jgi:hypothetical protein
MPSLCPPAEFASGRTGEGQLRPWEGGQWHTIGNALSLSAHHSRHICEKRMYGRGVL